MGRKTPKNGLGTVTCPEPIEQLEAGHGYQTRAYSGGVVTRDHQQFGASGLSGEQRHHAKLTPAPVGELD